MDGLVSTGRSYVTVPRACVFLDCTPVSNSACAENEVAKNQIANPQTALCGIAVVLGYFEKVRLVWFMSIFTHAAITYIEMRRSLQCSTGRCSAGRFYDMSLAKNHSLYRERAFLAPIFMRAARWATRGVRVNCFLAPTLSSAAYWPSHNSNLTKIYIKTMLPISKPSKRMAIFLKVMASKFGHLMRTLWYSPTHRPQRMNNSEL